jgi:SAM-dependent methyltransferase
MAQRAPGLRELLAHRDALVVDRNQLLAERADLNGRISTLATCHATEIAALRGTLQDIQGQLHDASGHRDQLADAVRSLQAERDVIVAQRGALQETAHALLRVRNEPRMYLAGRFLRGDGIEIGALHRPIQLPEGVTVRYVDRLPADDLRAEYPELRGVPLVDPALLDDGEKLAMIAPASVDFIIANHFLEHCEDPIGTLLVHLSRLRSGGHLFYAVPDKRHTFDQPRATTTLAHLTHDHTDGGTSSRVDHYTDYARHVHRSGRAEEEGRDLAAAKYSIHFHAWTSTELLELFVHIQQQHEPNLEVVAAQNFEDEFILVARKNGTA